MASTPNFRPVPVQAPARRTVPLDPNSGHESIVGQAVIPIVQAIKGQRVGPFTLTYLREPTKRRTRNVPEGTCLVLRNTGRHTVTDVHVRPLLDTFGVATATRLRKQEALGVSTGDDIVAYAAGEEVLVRWIDHKGFESCVWMRIPPLPPRYPPKPPSGWRTGPDKWGQMRAPKP